MLRVIQVLSDCCHTAIPARNETPRSQSRVGIAALKLGGPRGARPHARHFMLSLQTDDPRIKSPMLYPLS